MRSPAGKQVLGLLFLSAFLFLRVANAHTLSHYSDESSETECELCEVIIVNQELTPFVDQPSDDVRFNNSFFCPYDQHIGYDVPLCRIASPEVVYNKPPPRL